MALLVALVALLGVAGAAGNLFQTVQGVTPTEKVISLLEDLQAEIEEEGKGEAKIYDTFACFCKDTTTEKSDAIKEEQDNSDDFQANMEEQDSLSKAKAYAVQELDQQIAATVKEMEKAEEARQAELQTFEVNDNDLNHSITSIEGAIADLQAGISLLMIKNKVQTALVTADVLDLEPKRHRSIAALLQVSRNGGPDYEAHGGTQDTIETLTDLLEDFNKKKTDLEQEEADNKKAHEESMAAKRKEKHMCLVMFHVSWCKVCQRTFPEFVAAASNVTELGL